MVRRSGPRAHGVFGCRRRQYGRQDADAGALETTDATVITIVPDREGTIRTYSGNTVVSGSVTCSKSGDPFNMVAYLSQYDRKAENSVEGFGEAFMICTTTAQPFQLLVVPNAGEGSPKIGAPLVSGASVTADVIGAEKGPKIDIVKHKRRKGYHKKIGHRQQHLRVKITGITV